MHFHILHLVLQWNVPDNAWHSRPFPFYLSAHLLPLFDFRVNLSTPLIRILYASLLLNGVQIQYRKWARDVPCLSLIDHRYSHMKSGEHGN